ncbi:hypothetical protein V6Z11_A06G077800 [Gossypium hirsutum]
MDLNRGKIKVSNFVNFVFTTVIVELEGND